jgi:hypothetical protein
MGDGSKQNKGIHLSVYAFSPSVLPKDGVDLLITALRATRRFAEDGPKARNI